MDRLEKRAYAKVNITLDVLGRRDDGYHLVQMIMHSVGLYDVLTFERIPDGEGKIYLSAKNPDELDSLVTMDEKNLIYRAAAMLYEAYGIKDSVKIVLEKNIPVAAGLAGGSTDAAAAFKGINELFGLDIPIYELCNYGAKLGADIPYCIQGGTMLSEGIGEILTKLPDFPKAVFVLAKPECAVSTAEVYKGIDAYDIKEHERPLTQGILDVLYDLEENSDDPELDMSDDALDIIGECMANVLELVTVPIHPEIGKIKDIMTENGAVRAMMSGSGPTVFGIFRDVETAKAAGAAVTESGLAKNVYVLD